MFKAKRHAPKEHLPFIRQRATEAMIVSQKPRRFRDLRPESRQRQELGAKYQKALREAAGNGVKLHELHKSRRAA